MVDAAASLLAACREGTVRILTMPPRPWSPLKKKKREREIIKSIFACGGRYKIDFTMKFGQLL